MDLKVFSLFVLYIGGTYSQDIPYFFQDVVRFIVTVEYVVDLVTKGCSTVDRNKLEQTLNTAYECVTNIFDLSVVGVPLSGKLISPGEFCQRANEKPLQRCYEQLEYEYAQCDGNDLIKFMDSVYEFLHANIIEYCQHLDEDGTADDMEKMFCVFGDLKEAALDCFLKHLFSGLNVTQSFEDARGSLNEALFEESRGIDTQKFCHFVATIGTCIAYTGNRHIQTDEDNNSQYLCEPDPAIKVIRYQKVLGEFCEQRYVDIIGDFYNQQ